MMKQPGISAPAAMGLRMSLYIAGAVFIADQITKYLIKSHVGPLEIIRITSFFNIVYVENIGSAFGMFKSLGNPFFITVGIGAIIALFFMIKTDLRNRPVYALILGGAAGNITDRILHGYVIDFLDMHLMQHHWPAFNIADSALTMGLLLLAVGIFRH